MLIYLVYIVGEPCVSAYGYSCYINHKETQISMSLYSYLQQMTSEVLKQCD